MNVMIEIPKITDFKRINELAKQVHKLHVNWRPDLFLNVENVIEKEHFEQLIKDKEIFVAKIDDEIVGYFTVNVIEKLNPSMRYRKYLAIEAICVDENYRNKGIGTSMLEFAKDMAKENKCTDLYLTVNEENTNAIKLYEKFGFKVKSLAYSMKL